MSRRAAVGLGVLVVLAVGVRLMAAAYTHAASQPPEENRRIAENLVAGRGYTYTAFGVTGPTAVRTPVYPITLALLGPDRVGRAIVFNSLLGGTTVVAAFYLAKRLAVPRWVQDDKGRLRSSADVPGMTQDRVPRAAWLAAAFFAFWPTQVYAATLMQGLPLAVLLTIAIAWLGLRADARATKPNASPSSVRVQSVAEVADAARPTDESTAMAEMSRASNRPVSPTFTPVCAGLCAGLAALTEPVLLLPLLLLLGGLFRRTDLLVALLAAGVLVVPWAYRNAVAVGGPTVLTSTVWRDAFLGNAPGGTRPIDMTKDRIGRLPPPEYDQLKVPEAEREAVFREWVIADVRRGPAEYAAACLGRVVSLLFGTIDHPLTASPLYLISRSIAACGFFVLPFLARRSAGRWLPVCVTLTLGLVFATAFTRVEARLTVLTDVPQLLALAGAIGRWRAPA